MPDEGCIQIILHYILIMTASQIEDYLNTKRGLIQRIDPQTVYERIERKDGTTIIDTRPESFRVAEGAIHGALIIERNVLEWRLDPTSPDCIVQAGQPGFTPVIMCNEGYASSLAVKVLHEIGVKAALDLDGGFRRWKAEGLPVGDNRDRPMNQVSGSREQ